MGLGGLGTVERYRSSCSEVGVDALAAVAVGTLAAVSQAWVVLLAVDVGVIERLGSSEVVA